MKRAVVVLMLLSMAGCGSLAEDSDVPGNQADDLRVSRGPYCTFHQKPWVDFPTEPLYSPPSWDLRDPPSGLCGVDATSGDGVTSRTADSEGRPLSFREGGAIWSARYDAEGRVVEEQGGTGHGGGALTMTYARDGAVATAEQKFFLYSSSATAYIRRRRNSDCRTLEYEYEIHSYPSSVQRALRTERYDANGWPQSIEMTEMLGASPRAVQFPSGPPPADTIRRDADGREVFHRYAASGDELTSEFDALGRLLRRIRNHSGTEIVQAFHYDARGRLWRAVTSTRSLSTGQAGPATTLSVEYLRGGERRERVDLNSDGTVDETYQLTFDARGRLLRKELVQPYPYDREYLWVFNYCP